MSSPRARDGRASSGSGRTSSTRGDPRRSKLNEDEETCDRKPSLVPLAHHAVATVVYCLVGWGLRVANRVGDVVELHELTDHEKRALHYHSHPTGWVKTRLPVSFGGVVSLTLIAWMVTNWLRRILRVRKIMDARHMATLGALNAATLRFVDVKRVGSRVGTTGQKGVDATKDGDGDDANVNTNSETNANDAKLNPGDALSPCSDLHCLRCRPSAHALEMAKNGLRLRQMMKEDPVFNRNVSPAILALASKSELKVLKTLRVRETNQAPTVFRLPHLSATPVHNRGGVGCVDVSTGRVARNRRQQKNGVFGEPRKCACFNLWGDALDHKSDVRILEAAAPSIRREIESVVFAKRTRCGKNDENGLRFSNELDFAPFDPAVRKGGDWSAIYLYRNGIRDRRNCEAFPSAARAIEKMQNGCFGGGSGVGGCAFGSAYISKLEPGTVITPHCGPCNARLRVSVGIVVPKKVVKTTLTSLEGLIGFKSKKKNAKKTSDAPQKVEGRKSASRKVFDFLWVLLVSTLKVLTLPVTLVLVLFQFLSVTITWTVLKPFYTLLKAVLTLDKFFLANETTRPKCELVVSNSKVEWKENRAIVFDDSFVHSAEFVTGKTEQEETDAGFEPHAFATPRIVLIVDVWHPGLKETDRVAIQTLFPPGMGSTTGQSNDQTHLAETEGRKEKVERFT